MSQIQEQEQDLDTDPHQSDKSYSDPHKRKKRIPIGKHDNTNRNTGYFQAVLRIRISTRYGSGSFYLQAEIVRKTLIPTVL
jgi:hypothetical protein